MLGIYVHIPFCERKCSYCAFSSFACNDIEKECYVNYLIEEIENFHKIQNEEKYKKIDTIYIGGGTPSLLNIDQFTRIVRAIKDNFVLSDEYEFTIECNPNSVCEEKLEAYKELGVNRVSLGVQSLDDEKLKFIGRVHDRQCAISSIKLISKYFDNISCDMLIGLKDMKVDEFLKELDILISLGVKHISAYMLQVEEGTILDKLVSNNPNLLPNDDECVEIYEKTAKFLDQNGFNRYEVSNFAKEGYESRHNLKYWSGEDYLGFGLSAHSYFDERRTSNASSFVDYFARKKDIDEKLTLNQLIEEHIMLGLRCKLGVSKKYLKSLGYDIETNSNLKEFIDREVIISKDDILNLNPSYYGVNNYIIASLLPD